ncbi:MAG: acyltransferase [Candidatus Methanoperedens sp.]|nr:acyltransferase [Candidatus Methanoperedens sp.]
MAELKGLIIPDHTVMEEHSIVVQGDIIVGNYAELGYGLIANLIVAGEHVKINGNVISRDDVRIDMWSEIQGEVRTKSDAYLGEFVKISGKLFAAGNLDVGNDVKIDGGYDVKGWLVVRQPLPVVMFIFFYLMALLQLGSEEEVEKALEELFSDNTPENKILSIPNRAKIDLNTIRANTRATVGSYCRLLGNFRSRSMSMGNHDTLFGSIRTSGDITVGKSCTIHGNLISTKGKVRVGRNSRILGKITADTIQLHETSITEGALEALNGVTIEKDDLEGFSEIETKLFYGFLMLDV